MKIERNRKGRPGDVTRWAMLFAFLLLASGRVASLQADPAAASPTPATHPSIQSVALEATEVVVVVQVPAGVQKITLESRSRLGAGNWVPRAVERLDGRGGSVTIRLPRGGALEILRVRGDWTEPLPAAFYQGPSEFAGSRNAGAVGPGWAEMVPGADFGRNDVAAGGDGGTRSVVESDIWVIRDQTIYFFNQYRGLQVLDLTQPDQPVLRGEMPIAAAGEQMYVVGEHHAVLLARNGCGWSIEDASQVLIVDVSQPAAPVEVARVPLEGSILESRLVGDALYVATQTYRRTVVSPRPGSNEPTETWEYGTVVTGIDLAQPAAPVRRNTLWFAGYGNVVTATDRFLFVATHDPSNWYRSQIQVIDIAAPDGTLVARSMIRAAGWTADKFKMHLFNHPTYGEVFAVISEDPGAEGRTRASVLETFRLKDPALPTALGQIRVGTGESLFATRFDGDRAYIVTFLRVDPLWVVDLKDPAQPRVYGELEVPGWSTYIHPLGHRLVTVGIDNTERWRVAVSLFDVEDPSKPALLAKVPLGEDSSWSEANHDEKAFTVLPDAGLILVPYQGWSEGGYASRVQLIDLDLAGKTLKARGVIDHRMQPRRATALGDRLVSVSGRELIVVNAANRDQPVVTAQEELSWGVNRVVLAGDHLIEVTEGSRWNGTPHSMLHVVASADPETLLASHTLASDLPVLGVTRQGARLLVLQGQDQSIPVPPDAEGKEQPPKTVGKVKLSVFALDALPQLTLASEIEVEVGSLGWGGSFSPLWPQADVLVWSGTAGSSWWRWYGPIDMVVDVAVMPGRFWWPWWSNSGGRLIAFKVPTAGPVALASDLTLEGSGNTWSYSAAHTAGGLVFLSHQDTQFVPASPVPPEPIIGGEKPIVPDPVLPTGYYETKYYLDVVDFADPDQPVVRKPVDLPGSLLGVGLNGALVFTSGYHYETTGQTDGREYADALAYDGVSASLIATLPLPAEWPRATLVHADALLVSRPDGAAGQGILEAWALTADPEGKGRFTLLGKTTLASPAHALETFGDLLVAQGNLRLDLFNAADLAQIQLVGGADLPGCVGTNLEQADGQVQKGLWVPLYDFGLLSVPLKP